MSTGTGTGAPVTITGSSYASLTDVAALCINLLEGASTFSASTMPTSTSVEVWLDSGAATINAQLASKGYDTPVASTTALYTMLVDLNMLYAAARAEMSRINVTLAPGERTRGQVFDAMFWSQLGQIADTDLTALGASAVSTRGVIYIGGISDDAKAVYEDDDDRIAPRFTRDKFKF